MFGVGIPLAVHRNVTISLSVTTWFVGLVTKLGRTTEISDKRNREFRENNVPRTNI